MPLKNEGVLRPMPSVEYRGTRAEVRTLAAYFGVQGRTIEHWMKNGTLPFLKIRRNVYFQRSDILATLNALRSKALAPTQEKLSHHAAVIDFCGTQVC